MAFLPDKILTILVMAGAGCALFGLLLTYAGQLTNYKIAVDVALLANSTQTPNEGSLSAGGTAASAAAGYTPFGPIGQLADYQPNFYQVGFIFVAIATSVGAAGSHQQRFTFACAALLFAGTIAFTSFFQWIYYLMRSDFAVKQLRDACDSSVYASRACSASSLFTAGVFFVWAGGVVLTVVAVAYILDGFGNDADNGGRSYSAPALSARSPPPASGNSSGHNSVQQGARPETVNSNADASHNV